MYYRRLKFFIIYLALNRGCFEVVLMINTPRTLTPKIPGPFLPISTSKMLKKFKKIPKTVKKI
jgi:hypothetical protein